MSDWPQEAIDALEAVRREGAVLAREARLRKEPIMSDWPQESIDAIDLDKDGYRVCCGVCRLQIELIQTEAGAVAAWNRRPDGWVPVAERLPDRTRYDLLTVIEYPENHHDMAGQSISRDVGYSLDRGWSYISYGGVVTHWFAMPALPARLTVSVNADHDAPG
jgi:hypothetical protein